MRLRAFWGTMLTLFMLGVLTLAFDIQPVKASGGNIYIRADGSVDPPTAPISTVDNVTYTLTADIIGESILIQRDNIIVDGSGYMLQGPSEPIGEQGFHLSGNNVTIQNTTVRYFLHGILLFYSSNSTIVGNNIINNGDGIFLYSSSNNNINGNNVTNNGVRIYHHIYLSYKGAIRLDYSSDNTIYGNNIIDNSVGDIGLFESSRNNTIYHNNFINNTCPGVAPFSRLGNIWDGGYPSGGNYWSDYIGDDFYSGPHQNETGFDWIIDTPYGLDRYPLVAPWPLEYKTYSLTVDPVFYDITGTTLIQPSSWTIEFPSGTTRTVSSPVTYNLTQTGNYSIVSIIWKGTEIIPEITLTTSLTSDLVWSPNINCLLPTSLSISLSSSTSYVGFKIEINGDLTCNEVGLSGAPILISYSVIGGESWNDITLVNTASDGSYLAVWMPSATGNYLVSALWTGNATYPGATTLINLAVIPFKEQNVFSVTSNSTVSELAFNSTSRELSFAVTGSSGTTGYVNVYIAKTLIDNTADAKVYLDGEQLDYTATSTDDSWVLHFTYTHSTHTISISLGPTPFIPPQLITPLSIGILGAALVVATVLIIRRTRRGAPPTILDGVLRRLRRAPAFRVS